MFLSIFLSVLALCPAFAEPSIYNRELTEKFVVEFEKNKCEQILVWAKEYPKSVLEPIALAILANCTDSILESAALFQEAENLKPNSQAILILYAKRMYRSDKDGGKEIWRKVKLVAREESVKRMADDYLSGIMDGANDATFGLNKKWSNTVSTKWETNYTANPGQSSMSTIGDRSYSVGSLLSASDKLRHYTSFGELGGQLTVTGQTYYSLHEADDYTFRLELAASRDIGDDGFVIFSPYGSHELQGGVTFQSIYGLSVKGVYFSDNYRQTVSSLIFKNQFHDSSLTTQQGTHFRFEYDWLFYPGWYELNFGSFIEHTKAAADQDTALSASISYSHNDIGLYFSFLARFNLWQMSLNLNGSTRQDTNDSQFLENGIPATRRRVDYIIGILPQLSFALEKSLKLNLFFNYTRTYSNMGSASYQDYNVLNRVYGLNVDYQMEWL